MNDDIIKLMKKRRSVKNKKATVYKDLNRKIQTECRNDKEKWIEEQCKELEDLEKKTVQQMYSNMKRMVFKRTCRPENTALKKKDGAVVMEQQDILDRWTKYIGDLFDDQGDMLDFDETSKLTGNDILESEVEAALKEMKFGTSPRNDNITAKLIIASKEISAKKICHLA